MHFNVVALLVVIVVQYLFKCNIRTDNERGKCNREDEGYI